MVPFRVQGSFCFIYMHFLNGSFEGSAGICWGSGLEVESFRAVCVFGFSAFFFVEGGCVCFLGFWGLGLWPLKFGVLELRGSD